jgi:hypothetical protein
MASSNEYTTKLTDSQSFRAWVTALEARATALGIWHLIDPKGTDQPLNQPIRPALPSLLQHQFTPTEDGDEPEAPVYHTMTAQQRNNFNLRMEYYKILEGQYNIDEKRYKEERDGLYKITTFFNHTVSPEYQAICCAPSKPMRMWIQLLELSLGVDAKQRGYRIVVRLYVTKPYLET